MKLTFVFRFTYPAAGGKVDPGIYLARNQKP